MVVCQHQECLEKAISFCWCESISLMCEYHLKEHLQNNINLKHSFKFFHSEIYTETMQTIENVIKTIIDGLENYNNKSISAQRLATAKLSNELSQSMKAIMLSKSKWLALLADWSQYGYTLAQESNKNTYDLLIKNTLENELFINLILSSSNKPEVIESLIKLLIKNYFKPELLQKKINWKNQKRSNAEKLIFKILITEKNIKELLASWSNSPLSPFKISFTYLDDSKMHWDKANALKADIQKIDKSYLREINNYSSSTHMRASNDLSFKILSKIYEDFLNIESLFSQTLDQKEIYLGRLEKIWNLYWKEVINTLAIVSFDPKTNEIALETLKFQTDDDWPSGGLSSSIITLPNSEIFCYTACDRYKSFIKNSADQKKITIESPDSTKLYEGLVYFENSIFAFGGSTNWNIFGSAKKYNLKKNRWETLAPLPKPASSCSCIVYKQKILLSGRDNKSLYQYNTAISSYSVILNSLCKYNKLLFSSGSKVYIIEGLGGIYESEKENEYKFTVIKNSISCNGYGQNSWISKNDSIYYSMWYEHYGIKYYSFNLKTKKTILVKELIWNNYLP